MELNEIVPVRITVEETSDKRCPPHKRVRVRAERFGKEEIYHFATKAEAINFCVKDLIGSPEKFMDMIQNAN